MSQKRALVHRADESPCGASDPGSKTQMPFQSHQAIPSAAPDGKEQLELGIALASDLMVLLLAEGTPEEVRGDPESGGSIWASTE